MLSNISLTRGVCLVAGEVEVEAVAEGRSSIWGRFLGAPVRVYESTC